MKLTKIILSGIFTAAIFFTSCSTLQQDIVKTIPADQQSEISDYEFRLVNLDADYYFQENLSMAEAELRNKACDKLIKDIDNLLKKDFSKSTEARLIALQGRAYLLEENFTKAKECCQASDKAYKGDVQTLVLSHRLGITKNLAEAGFTSQDKPVVLTEEAIDFYKKKDYMSAVAKFDEAFINAESFYREAYKTVRDNAWDLRSVKESSNVHALLVKKELTIGDMMMITQNHPSIIYPYTANNEFNENQLFKKLLEKGLITSAVKTTTPAKTYSYTKLTRAMEARFIWNIYCNKKDKPALRTKYSTGYSEAGLKSPIKDVKVDNEDFDAILGCVEYGFLDLPDGQNFNPTGPVSGVQFETAITAMKNKIK